MRVFTPAATITLSHLKKNSIDINVQLETFQVESWLNYHSEKLEKKVSIVLIK
jgi:hypothetical protein